MAAFVRLLVLVFVLLTCTKGAVGNDPCARCKKEMSMFQGKSPSFVDNYLDNKVNPNSLASTLGQLCGDPFDSSAALCTSVAELIQHKGAYWAGLCDLVGVCAPDPNTKVSGFSFEEMSKIPSCDSVDCAAQVGNTAVECSCEGECSPSCKDSFLTAVAVCRKCHDDFII